MHGYKCESVNIELMMVLAGMLLAATTFRDSKSFLLANVRIYFHKHDFLVKSKSYVNVCL